MSMDELTRQQPEKDMKRYKLPLCSNFIYNYFKKLL